MSQGWIKLHRKILDSRVFAKPELLKLWLLCLCKANHRENWVDIPGLVDPVKVMPGEFVTGRYSLHRDYYTQKTNNMKSELTLWRWLKKLESWGNLNINSYNKYTVVQVIEWDMYQKSTKSEHQNEQQFEQGVNNGCTSDEHGMNTDNNDKNDNKNTNHAPPTRKEVQEYFKEKGQSTKLADKFYNYYQEPMEDRNGRVWKDSKGDTVKSWKQKAIGVWFKDNKNSNDRPVQQIV